MGPVDVNFLEVLKPLGIYEVHYLGILFHIQVPSKELTKLIYSRGRGH